MEVVKKRIAKRDVSKVMREVGYNKTSVENKGGSNIEDQLAQANENAKNAPTMSDALNRAVSAVAPPKEVSTPTKVPTKVEPKGSKSEDVKKLKEKHKEPVKEKGPKKIIVDMSSLRTRVTFTGGGWKPLDIKIANNEIIKAFRIKIRDEYRKGI